MIIKYPQGKNILDYSELYVHNNMFTYLKTIFLLKIDLANYMFAFFTNLLIIAFKKKDVILLQSTKATLINKYINIYLSNIIKYITY